MPKRNTPTLSGLCSKPDSVRSMDLETIAMLLEECDAQRKQAEAAKKLLSEHVQDRYSLQVRDAYCKAEKDYGAVHVNLPGYNLEVDTAKKVEWDQDKLQTIERKMREEGDNPAEYIKVERKVEERKYTSWPAWLKKSFDNARTTRPGSITIKLTKRE